MSNTNLLRCGVVQFQHAAGAKDQNFAVVERLARQARTRDVKVLVFPEMCLTGYWHARHLDRAGWEDLSEPVPEGPSTHGLLALSHELGMVIGAGLVERDGERLFNTYVVALPDGSWHRHRKLHAFESPHISSGDSFTVFDTPLGVRIGVLICYDTNIVENVRATALLGCDILMAPHQTGGTASRSPHGMKPIALDLWHNRHADPEALRREFLGDKGRGWLLRWLPSRAHDNGLFVLFANGVGLDDDEVRTGNAMIIDCYGRIQAESVALGDDLVVADLDLSLLPLCTGRRWIRARRPELYGSLTVPLGHELSPQEARFSEEPT